MIAVSDSDEIPRFSCAQSTNIYIYSSPYFAPLLLECQNHGQWVVNLRLRYQDINSLLDYTSQVKKSALIHNLRSINMNFSKQYHSGASSGQDPLSRRSQRYTCAPRADYLLNKQALWLAILGLS
jgi:hypothetical protein